VGITAVGRPTHEPLEGLAAMRGGVFVTAELRLSPPIADTRYFFVAKQTMHGVYSPMESVYRCGPDTAHLRRLFYYQIITDVR
jgi:hypothetical protein